MSAATVVVSATVIASTAVWAEAFAKLPFVVGAETALARLDGLGLPALVIGAVPWRRPPPGTGSPCEPATLVVCGAASGIVAWIRSSPA